MSNRRKTTHRAIYGAGVEVPVTLENTGIYTERNVADRVPFNKGEHTWLAMCGYLLSDPRPIKANQIILDGENLVTGPYIGCYWCEEPYTPRLARKPCKPTEEQLVGKQ